MFDTRLVPSIGLAIAYFCTLVPLAPAADDPAPVNGPVSYHKDVRPILQAKCQGCHQPAKDSGEYVMTAFAGLLEGGSSGDSAVVPGQPDASELVHQIVPKDGKSLMPKNAPPLHESEIALISKWIAEGAKDDTPKSLSTPIDAEHPPTYTRPPVIASVDYSPDGKLLAVTGFHEVLLAEPDTGKLAGRLIGLSERVQSVKFSPDGGRSWPSPGGTPAGSAKSRSGTSPSSGSPSRSRSGSTPCTGSAGRRTASSSRSAVRTTRSGRSTRRRASRSSSRAPTATGCSAPRSAPTGSTSSPSAGT